MNSGAWDKRYLHYLWLLLIVHICWGNSLNVDFVSSFISKVHWYIRTNWVWQQHTKVRHCPSEWFVDVTLIELVCVHRRFVADIVQLKETFHFLTKVSDTLLIYIWWRDQILSLMFVACRRQCTYWWQDFACVHSPNQVQCLCCILQWTCFHESFCLLR